jgi:hypothetical protein
MPLVGQLYKLVWGGRLCVTESWSVSLHFIIPEPGIPVGGDAFEPAIRDWMGRIDSNVPSTALVDWIKFNRLDPLTGLYLDQGNANTHFVQPPIAGACIPGLPQGTTAVSTMTAITRGRASKGRFFPPSGSQHFPLADGRISVAHAQAEATSAAQLITDLNGSVEGECYVWSQVGQVQQEITGCRVGRVVDTQQRRRKNLVEEYQNTPVS